MTALPPPSDAEVINRHRRRYRFARSLAQLLDGAIGLVVRSSRSVKIERPRRILLTNYGHIGDVVMSTACLSILKSTWPDVEIGFLLGSWSRTVLEGHPDVARLHIVDHWFMDRRPQSRLFKAPRYWSAAREVANEIRSVGYDVAVDLRAYRPNAIPLLWKAAIPVRIGYRSVGFGPLLTHPHAFVFQRRHESEVQADLLRELPIPAERFKSPAFRLAPSTAAARQEADALFGNMVQREYTVIHVGASVSVRDWPVANWSALCEKLIAEGRQLVFTGRGRRDEALILRIVHGMPRCVNGCDKLSFSGLVELIRRAELVISVETMAGHIAAAVETPCVAIYGGMSDYRQWGPRPGLNVEMVTHVVPCWPCFQYNGCSTMNCLRDLPVEDVLAAVRRLKQPRMAQSTQA